MFLSGEQYTRVLQDRLRLAHHSASVVTTYATLAGIEFLLDALPPHLTKVRLLVRWDPRDLVSGSSDLSVYGLIRKRGFEMFVHQHVHAKFVLIDETAMIVGSANYTTSGLGLGIEGNVEAGAFLKVGSDECNQAEAIFRSAIRLSDDLYNDIKAYVEEHLDSSTAPTLTYPPSITPRLELGHLEAYSPSSSTWKHWIDQLSALRRDKSATWGSQTRFEAPYKPLLLIGVINIAELTSAQRVGTVELTDNLVSTYNRLWSCLDGPQKADVGMPFIHLPSDDIWEVRSSNGTVLTRRGIRPKHPTAAFFQSIGAVAHVNPTLGTLLGNANFRKEALRALLNSYFQPGAQEAILKALAGPSKKK